MAELLLEFFFLWYHNSQIITNVHEAIAGRDTRAIRKTRQAATQENTANN